MKKVFVPVLFLFVILAMVMPAAAQNNVPRFEKSDCSFTVPPGQTPNCGYLIVPENRSNPGSKTIKIAVAVFPAKNADKSSDPVIYLEGGPGGVVLATASLQFDSLFAPFQDTHDIILFDQRGVGNSEPSLDCKEATDFAYATLDVELTPDEYVQQYGDALKTCGQRLAKQGIDLSAYNSAESASDVNDMRAALGYDKLNLYGISYGTRLALTIMRDHPDAVRSSIIDSVVPLQASYYDAPQNAERVLNKLFDGCAADAACQKAYPDLKTVFYDLVTKLNAEPITIQVPRLSGGGGQADAVIDGDALIGSIFEAFYVTDLIPSLPKDIYDIQKGDYTLLVTLTTLQLLQLNYVSQGMYTAVQCKEELTFNTADEIQAALDKTPAALQGFVRRELVDPSALDVCAAWKEGTPNPVENQPVTSDIPTLVMSGEYDPVTPPDYGKLAAQTLSKSYFFEVPGIGHGVIPSNSCALSIAQAFLADPQTTPDSSCLGSVKEPSFITPDTVVQAVEVTMKPFTSTDMGFSGVVPDGWKEVLAGTFSRGQGLADQTALSYQVIPGANSTLVLPLLATQFGVTDQVGTMRVANGLSWKLVQGEFGGVKVDLALADGDGKVFVIILLSNTADEREQLLDKVLLPAIDAFEPAA